MFQFIGNLLLRCIVSVWYTYQYDLLKQRFQLPLGLNGAAEFWIKHENLDFDTHNSILVVDFWEITLLLLENMGKTKNFGWWESDFEIIETFLWSRNFFQKFSFNK